MQPFGHEDLSGILRPAWGTATLTAIAPATDINISLKDYIVFIQDLLKALQHKKSMISPASVVQLLSDKPGSAMGWENETWRKMSIHSFLGKSALFSNYTLLIKEKNIGIIVLSNSGTVGGKSAVLNFGRMLREYYCQ
ncbi:hypothetical protein [Paraflavitalea speifideaquila]|uniref:hypothetical protein n=1 Tax=Paraflavitalea speifideaquila TaxID=3076558 RepID=UPI0028EDFB31|nr:hypothetical protein [Paraflavitalea speifideiaquila]